MVFCTYCGQSFTRDEHLERHILTHTNVKPFKCFTCHMSFARRDLLQRHYTVHGRDQNQEVIPAANGVIPKSAGRTPIACSNCAKTKTKCDKKFPCSRCAGRNLRCTLRPTRRATKGGTRIGIASGCPVTPPDQTISVEPGLNQHQQDNMPPQQQRPPLRPASPKNGGPAGSDDRHAPTATNSSPSNFVERPTNGPILIQNRPSPQLHTPINGFENNTSIGYDAFPGTITDGSEPGSSPRFMLDWSQMHMPLGFDGLVEPQLLMHSSPEATFDTGILPLAPPLPPPPPSADGMLTIAPDLANSIPAPLMTPQETPKAESAFLETDIRGNAVTFNASQKLICTHHSIVSAASVGDNCVEMEPVIHAQDAWSAFRCTPIIPSTACPKTAKLNLERLEQTLKPHGVWNTWSPQWGESDLAGADHLTVMQLHESTRDKLLAITQGFLHKALDIHREGTSYHSPESGLPSPNSGCNFVLLPPARVLEYFLRSYANCFERYYPLTSRGTLDANELMHCYNERAASLLVLMMIAHGAMVEARLLTGGLTEASRINLFDLIEKSIIMAHDPIVLHAALLFTVQAAWSGDKWQMDTAIGQRGTYFAMLRHSGALESWATATSTVDRRASVNTDQLWIDWIQSEHRSRLVYAWIMLDQELALFHDTAPLFSVTECTTPMPDTDRLWHAKTAAEWSSIFEQVHEFSGGYSSVGSGARPLSLRDLFRHFLDDEMVSLGIEMTPLQLRLSLHPLQSLCANLSQLLQCFSELPPKQQKSSPMLTADSTRNRLQEVQSLLQRWFDLAERYLKTNPLCPMMKTNLIIFHLISLNAVTNFAEVERLARRENFDGTYPQLMCIHKHCIFDIEEAVFHCGQVFRLIRMMPLGIRPPWWSGAVYRVGLVLWIDALTHNESGSPSNGLLPVPGPSFAIDNLPADHPLIVRYLTKREGTPCVTKNDGSQIGIDHAFSVLQYCIGVIDEGAATRFSDGIRAKLERLAKGSF